MIISNFPLTSENQSLFFNFNFFSNLNFLMFLSAIFKASSLMSIPSADTLFFFCGKKN